MLLWPLVGEYALASTHEERLLIPSKSKVNRTRLIASRVQQLEDKGPTFADEQVAPSVTRSQLSSDPTAEIFIVARIKLRLSALKIGRKREK